MSTYTTIGIGAMLPAATLYEFIAEEAEGCSLGKPESLQIDAATANKKIIIFAVPGAFTPTCSSQHVPGFLEHYAALKEKGVDEIWCLSVNDPFVMGAWGRDLSVGTKIRMIGDGSGEFTKKVGLEFDLVANGLGVRSQRYAMVVENGQVTALNVEAPGQFKVSDAASVLKLL